MPGVTVSGSVTTMDVGATDTSRRASPASDTVTRSPGRVTKFVPSMRSLVPSTLALAIEIGGGSAAPVATGVTST